jgi:hypothetical protein
MEEKNKVEVTPVEEQLPTESADLPEDGAKEQNKEEPTNKGLNPIILFLALTAVIVIAFYLFILPQFKQTIVKPVLYLYPKMDNTKIKVSFANPNRLTTTYPKFNKVWEVIANRNGDLYDAKGNYYYGLYWEEDRPIKIDFSEGFYVTKDNAIDFLEEKLSTIGLSDRERNEFIMYWLPILEKNERNLVYFELTESREANNKLIINPKPDSLLRIAIHVKKVDKKIDLKEQKLPTFNRTGFTVVEWGGTIVK